MDGYAVRAADVSSADASAPVDLPVSETVRAGQRPTRPLAPGSAVRVMTGAPVPDGADTVIRVEDTDGGEDHVVIRNARDAGRNVRPRGEDLQVGSVAVAARLSARPRAAGRARVGRVRDGRRASSPARGDSHVGRRAGRCRPIRRRAPRRSHHLVQRIHDRRSARSWPERT